jgi:hypothetical protein
MRFSAENGLKINGWRGVCNFVRAAKERFESHSLPAYSSEVRTNAFAWAARTLPLASATKKFSVAKTTVSRGATRQN